MRKRFLLFEFLLVFLLLVSCASSKPFAIEDRKDEEISIIWVGKGEFYKYSDGAYRRMETNDYHFEVVQRRYFNEWKSVKNLHYSNPASKRKARKREKTMYFDIRFIPDGDRLRSVINSTLGSGTGISDKEFREQVIEFDLDIPFFVPYNSMRITQHYDYEQGVLNETVELYKRKKGKEIPFAKIEEKAVFYLPVTIKNPPTIFKPE